MFKDIFSQNVKVLITDCVITLRSVFDRITGSSTLSLFLQSMHVIHALYTEGSKLPDVYLWGQNLR